MASRTIVVLGAVLVAAASVLGAAEAKKLGKVGEELGKEFGKVEEELGKLGKVGKEFGKLGKVVGRLVISGVVPCNTGSLIDIATSPAFPDADVELRCMGKLVAGATTNTNGSFTIEADMTNALMAFIGGCTLMVDTPLIKCNADLSDVGALVPIDNGDDRTKDIEDDNSAASDAHGNEHIAAADEIGEETFCDKEHDKDRHVDAEIVYPCERSIYLVDDSDIKFNKPILPNDSTVDSTQGKEEGCIDDGNMTNSIHGNENLVFADEDVAEKVHSNEELAFDHTRENEESHVEDDDPASYIHGEENAAVVDEYVADTIDKDEHGKDQQSLEAEFFISEHVKSEVIFQQKESVTDGIEQKVEYVMVDDNMTNSIQKDSAAVAVFSSWSNKRSQCRLPSFNKDKEQVPYKYRGSQVRQGLQLDAEDFRSIHHFIEPQVDGTSSSLSSGSPSQGSLVHRTSSKFNNIVRNERLKKMDELRDKLSRLSSQKGMEKWSQKRGLEYQQQSNSYDVEQHLHSVDADSIPSSCAQSYYCHERPPMYQPSNHFSPTQTYPHCHFGHAQANIPFNYDMWEFNSYYQSSYAESTVPDHDSLMPSYKELKRVARKHILRPLSGASPFSICSSCFNLIQMPSDMYISKSKVGKMQCGKCAKVLVLSFHSDSVIAKNKDATSHSAECLRGPVSINEEYRASFTRSFSTQAGAGLAATQSGKKVSDSALHRLMGYDSASQLLRYSRPLDDGYDRFDSMVPVSSRVSQRKNM